VVKALRSEEIRKFIQTESKGSVLAGFQAGGLNAARRPSGLRNCYRAPSPGHVTV